MVELQWFVGSCIPRSVEAVKHKHLPGEVRCVRTSTHFNMNFALCTRNAAIRKFADSNLVTFGDVDLNEESIRGIHTPGWGGW